VHVHWNYLHSLEFGTFVLYCFYLNVSKWVIVYVISVFMNVREILECVHVVCEWTRNGFNEKARRY